MRIAYVCTDPGIPVFGNKGASIHIQEVIRAFRRCDATVELFAARFGGEAPADLRTMPLHILPSADKGDTTAMREHVALTANEDLTYVLQSAGPFDLIYERYALWSFAAMEYSERQGVPGLLEVNAPLIEEQSKHRELVAIDAAKEVAKRVFSSARYLLAVSQPVADYLAGFVDSVKRIKVVPNGVDVQRFAPVHAEERQTFTVGFVGTLKPWHGLPFLIDAFALLQRRCSAARLLIVGDGPERAALEHQLQCLELDSVATFTGSVVPENIPDWLAAMDVAIAPYPDQLNNYFSPLKLYEYMAMGLPVVASRVGQAAEVIEHDINGLLYPPGDAQRLADTLLSLQRDPTLRRRLGKAARDSAATLHTWDAVVERILKLVTPELEHSS